MTTLEKMKFNAEVDKVLHLMIHSLYTNKDIFLRELISNSADACDRLKYEANVNSEISYEGPLGIKISVDDEKKEIVVEDNGIGMSREELVTNLGTIANSGTQRFLENMTGDNKKDVQLIGQFGVGFYSVFMVSQNVTVISKKVGAAEACQWFSEGDGEFILSEPGRELTNSHGTMIVLKLKDEDHDFLDRFKISHVVNTYSNHISIPIEFTSNKVDQTGTEVLNSSSAIWMRSKSEVTEEEYQEFYKKVSFSADTPWMTLHNKSEGAVEYTNLLFIPSQKTFDMFHPDRKRRIKLYIKRVFINDEGIDIIPQYLRFMRGVVDSDDLPLNISREVLQHNRVIEKIKQSIINRALNEFSKKLSNERESYINFWENFGAVFKEGLCESSPNSEKILDVCLFKSVKTGKLITLQEYVDNMQEGQDTVYYISGDNADKLADHPQLEKFKEKDVDVLLFTDTVDDFWVSVISTYKEKALKSVTRSNIDLDDINSKKEDAASDKGEVEKVSDDDQAKVIQYFKDTLQDMVKDVKASKKLSNTPVCLVVDEGALDIRMERFLIEQKQLKSASTKILEINVEHPIIKGVLQKVKVGNTDELTQIVVKMLFDQACVVEGESLFNPLDFSKRLNDIIMKAYIETSA